MKKIILFTVIALIFTSCKYDDDYLNPSLDTIAYFASFEDHTRTLVVGEGLHFKIGAAMAGELTNTEDRTVDFKIYQSGYVFENDELLRELMPLDYYNSGDLSGTFQAIIPKGEFLGYFDVVMDSVAFLNDPKSLDGTYTLPVKIVATSLDSIGRDSVNISVKYMCGVDGNYLYESVIKTEVDGVIMEDETVNEVYSSESDDNVFSLVTTAPFQVLATGATTSFCSGLKFYITVKDGVVSVQSVEGQPVVELEGDNVYDPSTGDFDLNFKYQKSGDDAIYHVSIKLIFRNRVRDGVNETRDYLSYFRK